MKENDFSKNKDCIVRKTM